MNQLLRVPTQLVGADDLLGLISFVPQKIIQCNIAPDTSITRCQLTRTEKCHFCLRPIFVLQIRKPQVIQNVGIDGIMPGGLCKIMNSRLSLSLLSGEQT